MTSVRRSTAAAATAVVFAALGGLLAVTATSANAAVTCATPAFKRQLFANTTFSGTPKKTDCDAKISENWGTGAPATGLPADKFGVRWTVTRDFGSGGPFALSVSGLDGIRVYLDPDTPGARKINLWKNGTTTVSKTLNLTIPKGKHTLRIDYVNWTGSAKVKFTYMPRTSATVDKIAPLPPTAPTVAYDKTTGKAKLTWAKNKEMDLAGYRVLRRPATSDIWKRLTDTAAGSAAYTDTTLAKTGETYVYEIRAYDKAGNESAGSADRLVTTVDRTPPPVPSPVKATDGQPGVTLTWNAVPGAAYHLVHRRWDDDGGDNPVVQVAKVTSTSWLDTTVKENLNYSYWVTAVDAAGNKSAKSAGTPVSRGDHAPSAPTGLTATTQPAAGIGLTWQAPKTPIAQDLSHYRIYRGGRLVDTVRSTQTSFVDSGVRHGRAYTYTVTAVDFAENESAASASATAVAPTAGLGPAAVTGLTGVIVGQDVELTWRSNPEADEVDHYDIYRGQLVDGTWQYELWNSVDEGGTDPDEPLSYVQELYGSHGETVRWAVIAVDIHRNSRFGTGEEFSYVTLTEPVGAPDA
ncbi:fibronectin type III domain-containing protein [Streptomyces sp. NPDC014892]|uniref:fibronectin type III domain-containing protein n=1 Tax=Streptomyces sp. NPDC014892 TaxID=3364930 RepID=UPI0036F8FE0E